MGFSRTLLIPAIAGSLLSACGKGPARSSAIGCVATSNDVVARNVAEAYYPEDTVTRQAVRSIFRGRIVTHSVVRGQAVAEGDILLGPASSLAAAETSFGLTGKFVIQSRSSGVSSTDYLWPDGKIPYVIDSSLPDQSRLTSAINHWNTKLSGVIQFAPRESETSYVYFARSSSSGTCASPVGYWSQGPQAVQIGDDCSVGNLIHELGHTVGLWHEQSRADRDDHVEIHLENVMPGYEGNFDENPSASLDLGDYDFGSIMHYPSWAFSANGLPTIETIPAGMAIGQRAGLSDGDVLGVKILYGAAPPGTPGPRPTSGPIYAPGLAGPCSAPAGDPKGG